MNRRYFRRDILRRVASRLTRYRQGRRPNIAIFAIRRGGSTLLADMLACERGVLLVDEPFNLLEVNTDIARKTRWLRPPLHSEFFDPEEEDRERLRAYMKALLAGRTGMGVCRHPKFPCRADRMVLKILHATPLLDWLMESFGLQVVRLLRHPAPQALSVLRAGWRFGSEAYFERPAFLRSFLGEDQVEFAARILAGPSTWRMAILDWCISYRLLVHFSRATTPLITFEELTLDPLATSRFLCGQLELSDPERIGGRVRQPSNSPGGCSAETLRHLESGDSWSLIKSWCGKVDAAQAAEAQEILDRFEVSIYNMSNPLPDTRHARIRAARAETDLEPIATGQRNFARREATTI